MKTIQLDPRTYPLTVRILQVVFGILIIVIAVFWVIFNVRSVQSDRELWITILLLTAFGLYQIFSGFGKTKRYIEIGNDLIVLKKNSLLPKSIIKATEIEKIESYPLSIIFHYRKRGRTILRFGISFTEVIEPVRKSIMDFASTNNIPFEIKDEA